MKPISRLIDSVTNYLGHPLAVVAAIAVVCLWLGGLPHFGIQDQNYQLLINTGTTIVTFVMVFCVQHTQNKDSCAMQIKLDELVRAVEGARDSVAGIEKDADLLKLEMVGGGGAPDHEARSASFPAAMSRRSAG